jgi:hypothetical protein
MMVVSRGIELNHAAALPAPATGPYGKGGMKIITAIYKPNIMYKTIASLALIISLTACSAEKKLHNRLVGTWEVASFNENSENSNTNLSNIGTVSFAKDGRGSKELSFRLRGEQTDNTPFTWSNTATTITVQSDRSQFSKAWIIIQNKKKQQLWKSTNGKGGVQEVLLKKKRK